MLRLSLSVYLGRNVRVTLFEARVFPHAPKAYVFLMNRQPVRRRHDDRQIILVLTFVTLLVARWSAEVGLVVSIPG